MNLWHTLMFVETSTVSTTSPIGVTREQPMLAQLFLSKYGIFTDKIMLL